MNLFGKLFLVHFFLLACVLAGNGQVADTLAPSSIIDTLQRSAEKVSGFNDADSARLKNPNYRDPRKAAIRSAVLPGWGQLYNKKGAFWKVPAVYVVLGATVWNFLDNRKWYKEFKLGYKVAYNIASRGDSTGYDKIKFFEVKNAVDNNWQNELQSYRDNFRRNLDYAAVYIVVAWGLNVMQATVDAHLSSFDISPNLTFKVEPGYSELANTNGVSLVLRFK